MLKIKLIAVLCLLSMLASVTAFAADTDDVTAAEISDTAEVTDTTDTIDTADTTDAGETDDPADTTSPEEKPTPAKVQDIVYKYLTEELELTPAAAAGIMGNVMIECTFDPTALAVDTNGLYSFGLMMWNGPRFEALKKWCADNGYHHEEPYGQLGYLKWELLNTEKAAYATMKAIPNTVEGACKAAILWASDFERCTRTSFGLRIFYALNVYWPTYAGGGVSDTHGIYGYYYNVPENIKYGSPLTLYGAVVSFSSNLKSITAGVYTEDGELVTGRTVERDALVGNIGVLDSYIVMNKVPKGSYYYTISAVNEAGEYIVERHSFTVSDEPTTQTLVKETVGYTKCGFGAYCPGHVFSDMPAVSNWAHGGIDYVVDAGLFEGKPGGIFAPKENMSRAMFVTVLCRLGDMFGVLEAPADTDNTESTENTAATESLGETEAVPVSPSEAQSERESVTESGTDTDSAIGEPPEEDPFDYYFKDVPRGKWFTEAVYRAASEGLVMGKSADTFAPNEPLTRAQLATLMFRFAELCGVDTSYSAEFDSFADGDTVPAWAKDAVSWAVASGLVTGSDNGGTLVLDPMGYATRAQVAAIVQRFVLLIENGGAPIVPDETTAVESTGLEETEPEESAEVTSSEVGCGCCEKCECSNAREPVEIEA